MTGGMILFRADGNANIGAGHVMRCLSIGMAARKLGYQCKYLIADSSFQKIIEANGFETDILNTNYSNLEAELNVVIDKIKEDNPLAVFVDSYYVTSLYLATLSTMLSVIYLDDIRAFAYPVDFLINYNAFAKQINYPLYYKDENVKIPTLLLGEMFVPLREEFQNRSEVKINKRVNHILFSAGGADPERIALNFVRFIIQNTELKKYYFHIVLGHFEVDAEEIKEISKTYPQIIVHEKVVRMSDLMRQCDLAVSAAGSTLYELCACGIPTITYILENNQILGAKSLCAKGIMMNVGDYRTEKKFFSKILNMILLLDNDFASRKRMHDLSISAVDGNGAVNIIKTVMKKINSHSSAYENGTSFCQITAAPRNL